MFHSLIAMRRSIRKFENRPVERETIERLIEAALRAPTSHDLHPWEFIVVTNRQMLEKLSRSKPQGASFLESAPLAIVVCGDESRSDAWIEDCSIASTYLLLAAVELGLGACWIQIRGRKHDDSLSAEAYAASLLHLTPGLRVESIIAVGRPAERKPPHPQESFLFQKAHLETFGQPFHRGVQP